MDDNKTKKLEESNNNESKFTPVSEIRDKVLENKEKTQKRIEPSNNDFINNFINDTFPF